VVDFGQDQRVGSGNPLTGSKAAGKEPSMAPGETPSPLISYLAMGVRGEVFLILQMKPIRN